MTTSAPRPTPAHELSTPSSQPTSTKSSDLNPQGLPIPRGPVTASLSFYSPPADGSPPHNYVEPPTDGRPQRNFDPVDETVVIQDVRGKESDFTLDMHAFAAVTVPAGSSSADFTNEETVKQTYYPEVEKLLLDNVPGAHTVFFFDHTIRRSNPDAPRAPVTRVHIDQTPKSAIARVYHHLPERAEELLRGRYRIINVWRPLNGPVLAHPLTFADSTSVPDEDLVAVEHRYPDRNGETAAVKYSAGQRWWYWSGMTDEERIFLKCFDTEGGRCAHSAFVDPRTPEGARGRESIEVRALVFG
ncbi:hypothetical protein M011DRAFT_466676 [Sporormia fimetaria CBS 119925]|uniref:Methyltransferase n=1 Tax=Sporormia fimetaria CBS 119925 TaxID=1340428 RepID=A0A6A6VCA4_9PLEO|nr:hypothetical protein M011DRAFT_466676 [Sporormia fimetaria CBS 119925]